METENERWKRVMTQPSEPPTPAFSTADYDAAARQIIGWGVFSRIADTEEGAARWQRDIDAWKTKADADTDPRMRKAMREFLKICEYELRGSRSVWRSIEKDRPEMERRHREWEATEKRAKELLRTRGQRES